MITDYISSYAIFAYQCGDLNSPGFQYYSAIGINAGNSFSINHPLSVTAQVTDVACSNPSSNWTYLAYRLNVHSNEILQPSPQQLQVTSCWSYHVNDINRECIIPTEHLSEDIVSLPPCPCSKQKIVRDGHFYLDPENDECYISRFPSNFGLGRSCCYRNLSR